MKESVKEYWLDYLVPMAILLSSATFVSLSINRVAVGTKCNSCTNLLAK